MSVNIEVQDDKVGFKQDIHGSDGRMNTSARVDSRGYYNSRDEGQSYSLPWIFNTAASTEYAVSLKNTSTEKTLVISAIGMNAEALTRFQLDFVTGTPGGGDAVTPTNLQSPAPHAAPASALEGGSAATGITGLTFQKKIDIAWVEAGGHEQLRLDDRLRLGQNEQVALQVLETTGGDTAGVIFFYFE